MTGRVKEKWTQKRNVELCELSARDPSQFWKAFKAPQSNACPDELSAQFEAFRGLMGAEPQSAPQRPADSGVSTSCPEDACLNADVTADELSQCIKRLKRGKSPGINSILADMIKDGGDLVQQCLLWLFDCMLASHFPERLSLDKFFIIFSFWEGKIFITRSNDDNPVYKTGDKSDMGNDGGITVDSVVAKLFAMMFAPFGTSII